MIFFLSNQTHPTTKIAILNQYQSELSIFHFEEICCLALSQIQAEESCFEALSNELQDIKNELLLILQEINSNRLNPLITHVEDKTYFDTFLSENGDVISAGVYTKIS